MVLGTLVVLVGSITTLATLVWNMWRSMKVAKEDALAVATDMGAKVEQVHALVNAADTEKLARIDRLTTRVAQLEPTPSNIAESDAASEALRVKNVVNEAARTKSQFVEESMKALRAVK
jgi:alanyl-tRNA synthetase